MRTENARALYEVGGRLVRVRHVQPLHDERGDVVDGVRGGVVDGERGVVVDGERGGVVRERRGGCTRTAGGCTRTAGWLYDDGGGIVHVGFVQQLHEACKGVVDKERGVVVDEERGVVVDEERGGIVRGRWEACTRPARTIAPRRVRGGCEWRAWRCCTRLVELVYI